MLTAATQSLLKKKLIKIIGMSYGKIFNINGNINRSKVDDA